MFQNTDALRCYFDGPDFESPVDGIKLVQEYIEVPEPYITRREFIGGEFLYAVRVHTSQGFELCPADECQLNNESCTTHTAQRPRFGVVKEFEHPILALYARFLQVNDIHIAGIEFIIDRDGELFTYDINVNTNYNPDAEATAGVSGIQAVADFLGAELTQVNEVIKQQSGAIVR